mmetsp:Transcript_7156/g.13597  ORF Transcript_7156/g.13597 Transcript_7156/m.13597 type:complete len:669 (-) Transcript_7156:22-2028(-)
MAAHRAFLRCGSGSPCPLAWGLLGELGLQRLHLGLQLRAGCLHGAHLLPHVRLVLLQSIDLRLGIIHPLPEEVEPLVASVDRREGLLPAGPARHAREGRGVLQVFVVDEEVVDLLLHVRRDVLQVLDLCQPGLLHRHGNDLGVGAPLIHHVHHGHGAHRDRAAEVQRVPGQDEAVHGIAIRSQGLRNEPVVAWVECRRVEDTVELQLPHFFAELVLVGGALGALHDGVYDGWGVHANLQMVQFGDVQELLGRLAVVRGGGLTDLLDGLPLVTPAHHLRPLVLLQALVRLKEVLDLDLHVLLDVAQVADLIEPRVRVHNGQQLGVLTLLVRHVQHPDHPRVHEGPRGQREGGEDQDVQRVPVAAQGAGHEAVVVRVEHRRVQHPVQLVAAGVLVELVLVVGALGALDVGLHDLREAVVPGGRPGTGHAEQVARRVVVVHEMLLHHLRNLLPLGLVLLLLGVLMLLIKHVRLSQVLHGALLPVESLHLGPLLGPLFVLQPFVVGEEVLDLLHRVVGQVRQVLDGLGPGVFFHNGDELLVLALLVLHVHHTHDSGIRHNTWSQCVVRQNQYVDGVSVTAQRVGHKSVVSGIEDGAMKDTIQCQQTPIFFELVLIGRSTRDLDEDRHDVLLRALGVSRTRRLKAIDVHRYLVEAGSCALTARKGVTQAGHDR